MSDELISKEYEKFKNDKIFSAPKDLIQRGKPVSSGNNYRSEFMIDRDRVLYSMAFRRLAGKTQVFLSGIDDHKRTRLTHTLEVSQIARTISKELGLDEDLTEAIALGHDMGHTPFGHAGERRLHEIMTFNKTHLIPGCPFNGDGTGKVKYLQGFKHNLNSLETSLCLEYHNDSGNGLNLTNFTLYGIKSHSKSCYKGGNSDSLNYFKKWDEQCCLKNTSKNAWSLEAFVVKEADEIAQRHHDMEDAIRGKIITKDVAAKSLEKYFLEYWENEDKKRVREAVEKSDEMFISDISSFLVNFLVVRIIENSKKRLLEFSKEEKIETRDAFKEYMLKNEFPYGDQESDEKERQNIVEDLITYNKDGDTFSNDLKEFEKDMSKKVLSSYEIQKTDAKGSYIILKIFRALYNNPSQLPDHSVIEFLAMADCGTEDDNLKFVENISKRVKDIDSEGIGELRNKFIEQLKRDNDTDKRQVKLMRVICNYIAGMTDNYAINLYKELY